MATSPDALRTLRDRLTAAGVLLWASDMLLAARVDPGVVRRLLAGVEPDQRPEIYGPELPSVLLEKLPVGIRLMLKAQSAAAKQAPNESVHQGKSWDAPGMLAPRFLKP